MSPTFEPPVVDDGPRTTPWNQEAVPQDVWLTGNRLMRHYSKGRRGRSVLRIGGTYRTLDSPSQSDIDLATEVYMGGHVYTVTDAVADALRAAGYTVT